MILCRICASSGLWNKVVLCMKSCSSMHVLVGGCRIEALCLCGL